MSVTAGGDEGEDCACEHHVDTCIDPSEPWIADKFEYGGVGPSAQCRVIRNLIYFPSIDFEGFVDLDDTINFFVVGRIDGDVRSITFRLAIGHYGTIKRVEEERLIREHETAATHPALFRLKNGALTFGGFFG